MFKPNGQQLLLTRLSILVYLPCHVTVKGSYRIVDSQSSENLQLIWVNENAIEMNDNLLLPEYILKQEEHTNDCELSYSAGKSAHGRFPLSLLPVHK